MDFSIGFIVDVAVLVLLAMTAYLAFRLNGHLRNFRESRSDMEGLVNRLSANIERAEKAIAGLQVSARNSGADMDKKIKESKFLSDELNFMNEAGNNLATRLEKLAEANRALLGQIESAGGLGPDSVPVPSRPASNQHMQSDIRVADIAPRRAESAGFAIHDRDAMESDDADMDDLNFLLGGSGEEEATALQSQAEREFFQALQRSRKGAGRS